MATEENKLGCILLWRGIARFKNTMLLNARVPWTFLNDFDGLLYTYTTVDNNGRSGLVQSLQFANIY